jgi:hypothetical protein
MVTLGKMMTTLLYHILLFLDKPWETQILGDLDPGFGFDPDPDPY